MVVEYIHSVSAVPSRLVLTVSEPGHNLGAHGGKYRSTRLVEQQSNQSNINTDDNTGAKFSMSENYNTTKFSTNSSTADIQKPKDHHVADAPSKATLYKATRQSFHGRDATSPAQACHGCHDSGSMNPSRVIRNTSLILKVKRKKLSTQIGHLEKRLSNGWR
jgi:hypothetical protein